MKVLLTGVTGFTGSHVLPKLLAKVERVRCFVRAPEKATALYCKGIEVAIGDLGDAEALAAACRGCDTLINVASIGFGHGPGVVRVAEKAGVKRAIFVSTTAIFTQLNARSKTVRIAAEEAIRASSLDWTILRPTMIYGTYRDRNICRLIHYVRRFPLLPVFGSGEFWLQPIYVDDLAAAIVSAVGSSVPVKKEYNLAGRSPLSYNELVVTVARLMGRRIRFLHLPYIPVVRILGLLEKWRLRLPVKSEQILRLNEHKAFPWNDAARDFDYSPRSFASGVEAEIRSLGIPIIVGGSKS